MKPLYLLILLNISFLTGVYSQTDDVQTLQQNAKSFMNQGDYANAALILVRALDKAPGNLPIASDLAMSYYMNGDNAKAISTLKPFLDKDNADEQCYQIAALAYRRSAQGKEAERIYKKGIKTFPQAGELYNDFGEYLWNIHDFSAINQWEKGIERDPNFQGNYYNASKYYYLSQDKVWSLIYGEIFVNLEPYTSRTAEIKNVLLEGYKKLFSDPDLLGNLKGKNKFEIAFLTDMNKQSSIVSQGISAETLTMIRTRFVLNWFRDYANRIPFFLFDLQKKLLEDGMFAAYNQWIFGAAQNLNMYQNWTSTHTEESNALNDYLKTRRLKIPENQFYH